MSEHMVNENAMVAARRPAIARDLIDGIASGRFPVGSLLPPELELCDQYGASRHTMRLAINDLVELGLLSRRKRAGTRVEARVPPGSYRQALSSLDDLIQFGASRTRSVQETAEQVLDPALAVELGCPVGSRWLRISSLRFGHEPGDLPVGWTDVYLDPGYADVVEAANGSPDTLVVSLVEARHGRHVAQIRQDITAAGVPHRVAAALEAEPGSPALRIIRRYLDRDGLLFEVSDSIHPAGRFTASSRLERHS